MCYKRNLPCPIDQVKWYPFGNILQRGNLHYRLLPGVSLDKLIPFLQKLPFEHHSAIAAVLGMNLLEVRPIAIFCHVKPYTCFLKAISTKTCFQFWQGDTCTACYTFGKSLAYLLVLLSILVAQMLQVSCHSQGITHSDIKPANIFVDVRDCQQMTHVLDWGLANQGQQGKEFVFRFCTHVSTQITCKFYWFSFHFISLFVTF